MPVAGSQLPVILLAVSLPCFTESELEVRSEFELPGLHSVARHYARMAETVRSYVTAGGNCEVRMVECIQEFALEREPQPLGDRNRLGDSDIGVEQMRPIEERVSAERAWHPVLREVLLIGSSTRGAR